MANTADIKHPVSGKRKTIAESAVESFVAAGWELDQGDTPDPPSTEEESGSKRDKSRTNTSQED